MDGPRDERSGDAKALDRARSRSVEAVHVDPASSADRAAFDHALVETLRERAIDLVVLAGYMRIAGSELVGAFRDRILNVYPALLPAFPGTRAVADALAWGVKLTGVTVHLVDEEVDHGPVVFQEAVEVRPDDDWEALEERIHEVEHRLLPAAVRALGDRTRSRPPPGGGDAPAGRFLVLLPLAYLVWRTFVEDGSLTLRFAREAYAADGLGGIGRHVVRLRRRSGRRRAPHRRSARLAAGAHDLPLRRTCLALALVPLAVPSVLFTIAWIFLGSPNAGLINTVAGTSLVDVFGLSGMILVEGVHLSPLVLLLTAAAVRSIDPSLEESALCSGASLATVLRRITLPLLRPALLAGALVSLIRALETFEVPALIGVPGGVWVFTSRIFQALHQFPDGIALAGAFSLPLVVLTCGGALLLGALTRRRSAFETVSGRGTARQPLALGRARGPAFAVVALYLTVTVVLPMLALIWMSTQPYLASPSRESLARASLEGYTDVLDRPDDGSGVLELDPARDRGGHGHGDDRSRGRVVCRALCRARPALS